MNKFDYALEFTLRWEVGIDSRTGKLREDGGLNNDDGSPTKWGIRQAANPNVTVSTLSYTEAREIYQRKYWNSQNLDRYELGLAVSLFDTGVNVGPARAMEFLDKTKGTKSDPAKELILLRENYYRSLRDKNPDRYGKFFKGWINRTTDLKKYIDIIRIDNEPIIHPDDKKILGYTKPKGD